MVAWTFYDQWKLSQDNGSAINFATAGDTIKCGLVTSSYVPNYATDQFWSTPVANEVSGTNYSAGGFTLANKTFTLASSVVTFANTVNASWAQNAGGFTTARIAVIYKSTGVNGTSPLICSADLGANVGNVAGSLTVQFDTAGAIWSKT